eukprot:scaffold88832_cov39-Phaeocystis_antarctica.AAC.1
MDAALTLTLILILTLSTNPNPNPNPNHNHNHNLNPNLNPNPNPSPNPNPNTNPNPNPNPIPTLGMDLLRLALERGATAADAARICSELLEAPWLGRTARAARVRRATRTGVMRTAFSSQVGLGFAHPNPILVTLALT